MTIPKNLVCAGYPHEDEGNDHTDHENTLAANAGFDPAQGGPIICKEPVDKDKPDGDSILVFVGVSHSNVLSKVAGKPGLFSRIYDEKDWITEKLSNWSDWSTCDHTCKSSRVRGCDLDTDSSDSCKNGIVIESYDCKASNYTNNQLPGYDDITHDDGSKGSEFQHRIMIRRNFEILRIFF